MQVCWDESAQATPNGQLVFFAKFLANTGVFDGWGTHERGCQWRLVAPGLDEQCARSAESAVGNGH